MNIDKSTTEAMLSMSTDMRAAQKAVESLSMVDLKKVEQKGLESHLRLLDEKCGKPN